MKIKLVENISNMKLDFFLKQNEEDKRIVLNPGESSWCDYENNTKSMILYERKNLIKITIDSIGNILDLLITEEIKSSLKEEKTINEPILISSGLDLIPTIALLEPDKELFLEITCDIITPKEKTYKGKKRGRKKKRGPKPGAKKKLNSKTSNTSKTNTEQNPPL